LVVGCFGTVMRFEMQFFLSSVIQWCCVLGCEVNSEVNVTSQKFSIKLFVPESDGMTELWLRLESVRIIPEWWLIVFLWLRAISSPVNPSIFALRFTDGEISWVGVWVTVFSPSSISGLRRPMSIRFGTKVAFSMRMMSTLRWQNLQKKVGPKWATYSTCATSETKNSADAEIGTSIAHGMSDDAWTVCFSINSV